MGTGTRFVGVDLGAETLKVMEVVAQDGRLTPGRRACEEHHKDPAAALVRLLSAWDWAGVAGAAATGRSARLAALHRVPAKEARAAGWRLRHGGAPATLVSIGSHGFSVLELRESGPEILRENSRCSQGTGNFLRQLVERFGLTIEAASEAAAGVARAAPLSGRCPVILKTDMTHLANKGEDRARILAGLFDAVSENVQVLVKPRVSPPRLALVGGVARSPRIRGHFAGFAQRHGLTLLEADEVDLLYLDALGCAVRAAERAEAAGPPPALDAVLAPETPHHLERVPALKAHLPRVRRMRAEPVEVPLDGRPVILGFDIGSTGSKAVAFDPRSGRTVWDGYLRTGGDPVGAAQALMRRFAEGPAAALPVAAVGATGSGREIVGSLFSICYGPDRVHVMNEIAAHAEGACSHDPRVDTIFEIGGQDAKYIRLSRGRVVDAAMNEACSAGTGSFIEEQGRRFSGIRDVVHLGEEALSAEDGVSLGQHCSVFMAEVIDEAMASGVGPRPVIAGIYDSVVQNYLNRVKGSRSVGRVIFCQGMPFAADALAAAVARQTGSEVVVPPDPGTVGALGIARLAHKALPEALDGAALEPARFLEARVTAKEAFVCKSTRGCGGAGNRCRIDRLRTRVAETDRRFTWGGGCSLWDSGTGRRKLPDRAPDPFREREALVDDLLASLGGEGRPVLALTDEFALKGLLPFFAVFLHRLGFAPKVRRGAGPATLKRGIEEANVPFCAPMQLFHGVVSEMAEEGAARLFLPMIKSLPRVDDEPKSVVCPIVQGAPDLLRWDLPEADRARILSPVFEMGPEGLDSEVFRGTARRLAAELGAGARFEDAFEAARAAQAVFDDDCVVLGRRALAFSKAHGLPAVAVLGRPYTLYNTVLNSNVPSILREQGAIGIPVDCLPVDAEVPRFPDMYWAHGQRNLRAAWWARRTEGVYALWASNYSCGPDSFNLHFFAWLMEGKPFAVIETDGHAGDAGTKTRVEAFLHCVREDREVGTPPPPARTVDGERVHMREVMDRGETVLVPRMGPGSEVVVACLEGIGVPAETLPMSDRESLRLGRRHTSGKECVPMTVTLGTLLTRLTAARPEERFVFFMPSTQGPCRFGVYHLLHRIVLERLGRHENIRIWSPSSTGYFDGVPGGFSTLLLTGVVAADALLEALYDTRPAEVRPGAADAVYRRFHDGLLRRLARAGRADLSLPSALMEVASGRLFGIPDLLRSAARAFLRVRRPADLPTVLLVGEIYVRCDPDSNDRLVERLEARGLRVRFAPAGEWLEYVEHVNRVTGTARGFGSQLSAFVQRRILTRCWRTVGQTLGWPDRPRVADTVAAAEPWLRPDLQGEAVLSIGGPVHEWREGWVDGVVNVGPLECMPGKIAEAQLFHVAEREGLLSLSLPVNGDPVDPEVLDGFAYEVRRRHGARREGSGGTRREASGGAARRAG